jgi:hypothetical protein
VETLKEEGIMKKMLKAAAMVTVVSSALLGAGCGEKPQERQAIYNAWCKLYDRHDITIDEWQMLRENYMLPGGDAKRAADAANSAASRSAAAMGASAARVRSR